MPADSRMLFASSASGKVMYLRRFTIRECASGSTAGAGSASLVFRPRRARSTFNAHFAASESEPASAARRSTSALLMLPYNRASRQRSLSVLGVAILYEIYASWSLNPRESKRFVAPGLPDTPARTADPSDGCDR